ncbi:50S ribosomal protein L2 [Candidatus Microgenomates bacterium]|nr:50S ribosomal protein L2 [Candidatus Microgenomates bacterium]
MLKNLRGTFARRFMSGLDYRSSLTGVTPEKTLLAILPKKSGRDQSGHVSSRHIGGREKRLYRLIDFRRNKYGIEGKVVSVEYDPNRTANISLIQYPDGEKRYILHPEGLNVGDKVLSSPTAENKLGNALPVGNLPIGTIVHNIEMIPGQGGKIVRGAGTGATILAKEADYVTIKLPSSETRRILANCYATVGTLDNIDWKNIVIGKAGRSRHFGIRPKVRGTAQNPRTHPHGGGEGRSGEGMNPKTPWGKSARGTKTRKRSKYSDKYIINHG